MLKTTLARFIFLLCLFLASLSGITALVIHFLVTPEIKRTETRIIRYEVDTVAFSIVEQMNRVQAQMRSVKQSVAAMKSEEIDSQLPSRVDEYKEVNIFGGG
ncbi:methyl-accepting chemotaxis protein, partial [Cronobacter sakazakii]|nr:methyl-accepting chemotaxis protein [Cronobacter sakazakii]